MGGGLEVAKAAFSFACLGSLAVATQFLCTREAAGSRPQKKNKQHHIWNGRPASLLGKTSLLLAFAAAFLFCFVAASTEPGIPEEQKRSRVGGNGSWCIAKPSTHETKLAASMEYGCKQNGVDCRDIGRRGACFIPNNAVSHASVAMNLYYKTAGMHDWNCFFNGTGLVMHDEPSIGKCKYA